MGFFSRTPKQSREDVMKSAAAICMSEPALSLRQVLAKAVAPGTSSDSEAVTKLVRDVTDYGTGGTEATVWWQTAGAEERSKMLKQTAECVK